MLDGTDNDREQGYPYHASEPECCKRLIRKRFHEMGGVRGIKPLIDEIDQKNNSDRVQVRF